MMQLLMMLTTLCHSMEWMIRSGQNGRTFKAFVEGATMARRMVEMVRWDEAEHINFRVRFIEPVVYRALEKQVGGGRNLDDHANAEPPCNGVKKNPPEVENSGV
jgi:hypothetical protein